MALLKGFPPSNLVPVVDFFFTDDIPKKEQDRIRKEWLDRYWKEHPWQEAKECCGTQNSG